MKKPTARVSAQLRQDAEDRLREKTLGTRLPETDAEKIQLIHELQVHQIELEMQNEELTNVREQVEAALEKYTDLYDFAPIGYFTVDRTGTIREANLAAARLLGIERGLLLRRRLELHVTAAARPALREFFAVVFSSETKITAVLPLLPDGSLYRHVQLEGVADPTGQQCRVVAVEVTASKRAETERERLLAELQAAMATVKMLSGRIPICASCKKIRDGEGSWRQIESYIQSHSEAHFSHGICPECVPKYFPKVSANIPTAQ